MEEQGKIIDGKAFAKDLRAKLALDVQKMIEEKGIQPGLAVVLVGHDPASEVYVRNKERLATKIGLKSFSYKMPEDTTEEDILKLIRDLNENNEVHGILVQLPLPKHLNSNLIIDHISSNKDVDGLHISNMGKLMAGIDGLRPCTPLGSVMLLKDRIGDLSGKNVVVLGRSNLVGKPVAQLLLQENCTVTIAHSRTKNLPHICKQADILVVAVGQMELVKKDWVKSGAVIIDVGINRCEKTGKLKGDVDFDDVIDTVSAITPVPGGVGPMTIACLLSNTIQAASLA